MRVNDKLINNVGVYIDVKIMRKVYIYIYIYRNIGIGMKYITSNGALYTGFKIHYKKVEKLAEI